MDRGVLVDTLETATTWSSLFTLYRAVGDALREHAPLVVCHISHLYPTGASLYFTYMVRVPAGEEIARWATLKQAASEAIVAAGGTITHHHAVGRDHAPYMRAEVGDAGIAALRALKAELDPAGIMNPGKLLPAE
jgi:alkyldihydroxyacetonephosphate synthase